MRAPLFFMGVFFFFSEHRFGLHGGLSMNNGFRQNVDAFHFFCLHSGF
jgi:hypothetical protein